jgi:hypothetical protein
MVITGIRSGDHECWCLLVTEEDFKRIKGKTPEGFDEGPFAVEGSPYRYKIYPDDLMGYEDKSRLVTIRIEVTASPKT